MKVTQPMIDRGVQLLRERERNGLNLPTHEALVEAVLRAALRDQGHQPPAVTPGQMAVEDYVSYG